MFQRPERSYNIRMIFHCRACGPAVKNTSGGQTALWFDFGTDPLPVACGGCYPIFYLSGTASKAAVANEVIILPGLFTGPAVNRLFL